MHHNFQDVDYHACYEAHKHVTAAAAFLTRDNAKMEIDRVLKTFVKERKPVYIAVPLDIAKMEISDKEVSYDWISDEETLRLVSNKIAAKINNAQKPVILGDLLVKRFDSRIEYKEFVEKQEFQLQTSLWEQISLTWIMTSIWEVTMQVLKILRLKNMLMKQTVLLQ